MKSRRMLGIAALGAAAASMVMVPGASAQESSYAASATGRALALNVGPAGLTLGQTSSVIDSTALAQADGAGVANPLSPVGVTTAKVQGADATAGSTEETCEGDFPANPLIAAGLACSSSIASITGGVPSAASTAKVGSLEANPINPLLGTPLGALLGEVEAGIDQVFEGLGPVLEPTLGAIDDNTGLGLEDTLGSLIDELFAGTPLLGIDLGESSSSTTVADGKVISACTANGAEIRLLDPPDVDGLPPTPPVVRIVIGEAATTVTADTATGLAEGVSSPSIATVYVPSSKLLKDGLAIGPGTTQEIDLGPLGKQTIAVAGPSEGKTDDGQTIARASGVRIHLLDDSEGANAFQGGIELALADCTSVAGATVALPGNPTTTTTQPPLLPRTGSEGPNPLALASVVGFAGLGFALLRRTSAV